MLACLIPGFGTSDFDPRYVSNAKDDGFDTVFVHPPTPVDVAVDPNVYLDLVRAQRRDYPFHGMYLRSHHHHH